MTVKHYHQEISNFEAAGIKYYICTHLGKYSDWSSEHLQKRVYTQMYKKKEVQDQKFVLYDLLKKH